MFKYTRAGINLIIKEIKAFIRVFKFGFLLFNISYYTFAIFAKIGNIYVNIALLLLALIYGIFDIFFSVNIKKKTKKKQWKIRHSME